MVDDLVYATVDWKALLTECTLAVSMAATKDLHRVVLMAAKLAVK